MDVATGPADQSRTVAADHTGRVMGVAAARMVRSVAPAVPYLLVIPSLVYFAVSAARHIGIPGLYYDEVLFVNAATGGESNSFIAARIFGIPVMLMSYIGALKAYLYAPIFALFGVSAATIRLPAIVISTLSIWLVYLLGRMALNRLLSAALVAVVACDPVFIYMTKIDYGPVVLMIFLKLLALLLFFKLLSTRATWCAWAFTGICLLGLYDKLDFIWFLLALVVAGSAVFRRDLVSEVLTRRHLQVPLATLLVGTVTVGVVLILPQFLQTQQANATLAARLGYVSGLYVRTMDGREFYTWITGATLPAPTLTNAVTLAALLILLAMIVHDRWRQSAAHIRGTHPLLPFYLLLCALIFAQIVWTRKAGGPHHIMMVYPFHHILWVMIGGQLLQRVRQRAAQREGGGSHSALRGRANLAIVSAVSAMGLAIGLAIASEVRATQSYEQAFATGRITARWSPAIYQLAAYIQHREAQVDGIVFVDWGIHNQVYALTDRSTRKKCHDLWPEFKGLPENGQASTLYHRYFQGRRVLVPVFRQQYEVIPGARHRFFAFARQFVGGSRLERSIGGQVGSIYEIYIVDDTHRTSGV